MDRPIKEALLDAVKVRCKIHGDAQVTQELRDVLTWLSGIAVDRQASDIVQNAKQS